MVSYDPYPPSPKGLNMAKHYTQEDFDKLTKRYAITEDPDDLGCVPTVTKKADMNTLQKDREKLRKKSESEKEQSSCITLWKWYQEKSRR